MRMIVEAAQRKPLEREQEFRITCIPRRPAEFQRSLRSQIQGLADRRRDYAAGREDRYSSILVRAVADGRDAPVHSFIKVSPALHLRRIQLLVHPHASDALEKLVVDP